MKDASFSDEPTRPLQHVARKVVDFGIEEMVDRGHRLAAVVAIIATPTTYAAPDLAARGLNRDGVLNMLGRAFVSIAIDTGRNPVDLANAFVHGVVGSDHHTTDGERVRQPPGDPTIGEAFARAAAVNEARRRPADAAVDDGGEDEELDPESEAFFADACNEANALMQRFCREGQDMTKPFVLGLLIAGITHLRANDINVDEIKQLVDACVGLTTYERTDGVPK